MQIKAFNQRAKGKFKIRVIERLKRWDVNKTMKENAEALKIPINNAKSLAYRHKLKYRSEK